MQDNAIQWTEEQTAALGSLSDFKDPGVFVLAGYAGTGKTTLVVQALKGSSRVCFTAPTHKAVGVLSEKGLLPGADYRTLHSLLGCRRFRDNGKTEYRPDLEKASWPDHDTIVIDEVSMVGETMWSWVMDAQAQWPRRIICMGDPAQLPPVKDGDGLSPAFDQVDAQLTEVMRSEGIVQRAATLVRTNLAAVNPVRIEHGEDARGRVQKLSRDEFIAEAVDAFGHERDAKVLAWTNDAVDWLNHRMRQELFGLEVEDGPQPGELLCVVRTWASADELRMLHAESEVIVDDVAAVHVKGVAAWEITTRSNGVLYQVRPEGQEAYATTLSNLKFEARRGKLPWREFYAFQDEFIQLRPGYATTVHKSQGSTYDETFVVDTNLCGCHEVATRNMLRYVAFSRAASRLVLA